MLAGSGSGLRPKGPRPVLLQAGAQLPGRLNARVEEEKPRRRLQEDRRGSLDGTFKPRERARVKVHLVTFRGLVCP